MAESLFGIHAAALELRSQRMGLITSNIANAGTPGYKAKDIDFAAALRAQQGGASTTAAATQATRYRVPLMPSLDGNTVEMATEQTAFAENAVAYQATLSFIRGKVDTLTRALQGRLTVSGSSIFGLAQQAMSAQLVRMNAASSNLANAGTVSATEQDAYRPIRAVFAEQIDRASGLSSVRVSGVVRETAAPVKEHNPNHPLADENGDVWTAPVDENAEMVEMLDASRQYQNVVEALSTVKQLMLETMRMK